MLTHRLVEVIPFVTKALLYDVKKGSEHNQLCDGCEFYQLKLAAGSHSIGTHVRDAACYVAWAFARAYEPSVMAPHVVELAPTLIITALFDRYSGSVVFKMPTIDMLPVQRSQLSTSCERCIPGECWKAGEFPIWY